MSAGVICHGNACRKPGGWQRDLIGIAVILIAAIAGYFLFPNNLALLTRMIAIMLLVLSLDLVTGYCGVATLGHAALFGSGAYAAGIAAAHFGITEPITMIAIGAVGGALAGLISGVVILRGHGLAQLVLSIAIIHLFHEAANKASEYTGGSDGLSGISPDPILGLFEFDLWGRTAYVFGIVLLLLVFILLRILVRSPFGMLCRGIRQDPVRVSAMGASVKLHPDQDVCDLGVGRGCRRRLQCGIDTGRRPRQPELHQFGRSARHAGSGRQWARSTER